MQIDDAMSDTGVFYARFMDDWVILAPTPLEDASGDRSGEQDHGRLES